MGSYIAIDYWAVRHFCVCLQLLKCSCWNWENLKDFRNWWFINLMVRVCLRYKWCIFIMSKFSFEYFSMLSKLFCNFSRYHDFDWQECCKKVAAKRVVCHNLYLGQSFVTNMTAPGKFVPIIWHFCRFLNDLTIFGPWFHLNI